MQDLDKLVEFNGIINKWIPTTFWSGSYNRAK